MQLLTIEEVCNLLKVSRRTVYNYIKSGKLPCVKLSKNTLRFREFDIEKLISDRTICYEPNEKTEMIAKKILDKILDRG